MNQLYVCSRPIRSEDGSEHRHLIGILSQLDNGEYRFEYKLDIDSAICENLILPIFPNPLRTYNDAETRVLLDDYFPSENDTAFMREILKKSGLDHYDEWEWLKTFESTDSDSETILCETLPDGTIRHDGVIEDSGKETDDDMSDIDVLDENTDSDASECEDISEFDNSISDDIDDIISSLDSCVPFGDDGNDNDDELLVIPENMFDGLDETLSNAVNLSVTEKANKKPKPQNTITTVIVKTTHKRKKSNSIEDFIDPAPESPMELLQQRLAANQKKRQEELAIKLKENPYN